MYVIGKNFGGIHTGLTVVSVEGILYGTYVDESLACHMVAKCLKEGIKAVESTVTSFLTESVYIFDI